jgi:hypothetical protein
MTRVEFFRWVAYYEQYPFDDYHRFHRPAALVAYSLGGGQMGPYLDWLQPPPQSDDLNDADMNTLRAFGFAGKAGG